MRRLTIWVVLFALVLSMLAVAMPRWPASAAEGLIDTQRPQARASTFSRAVWIERAQRRSALVAPGPTIEAYIRPEFAREMRQLRPVILDAARRHNRSVLSGMDDEQFATVIALLLYNENFGSLEERVVPLRALTPFYQDLQVKVNETGANLSVWPANLRPSVALEILRHQLPTSSGPVSVPVTVAGSRLNPTRFDSQHALYAALTDEISRPTMAVEYLAANLERGVYRARIEGVPVTWRALAAWHNQGVVSSHDIRANPVVADYVRRTAAYLPAAQRLIETPIDCHYRRCAVGDAEEFAPELPGRW